MAIYICPEFIRDLVGHGNSQFARRVLDKAFTKDGGFAVDADDHPYEGITNVWIRYVSRGNSAYRAIFVRNGSDIFWYRAGEHSVEDRLQAPRNLGSAVQVSRSPITVNVLGEAGASRYLKSTHPRLLRQLIGARRLVPHKTVLMISPRISPALVGPTGDIGRLINSVFEWGGSVSVITKPPNAREFDQYRRIAASGVDLLIHEGVNARMFYFEIDEAQLTSSIGTPRSLAIIGSAEITEAGLNVGSTGACDEELCYEVYDDDLEGSLDFVMHLTDSSMPFDTYRARRDSH